MKLIKENKYEGTVSRKVIKSAISISLAIAIFTAGFGGTKSNVAIDESLGYSTVMQIKDKKDYIQAMILKEKILPYTECNNEENKRINSIISQLDNKYIQDIDSQIFRNYVLKNYIDYLISNTKSDVTEEMICSSINSSKGFKFKKNGLDYKIVTDFSEKQTENYSYISQSVSNKKMEFFVTNFRHNSIDNFYEYCSYEITRNIGGTANIKSIIIERYKSTTKEKTIDNYYKDISVKMILSNGDEVTTKTSIDNIEILRNSILENFEPNYTFDDFIFQNNTIFEDIFKDESNLFFTPVKSKTINQKSIY